MEEMRISGTNIWWTISETHIIGTGIHSEIHSVVVQTDYKNRRLLLTVKLQEVSGSID